MTSYLFFEIRLTLVIRILLSAWKSVNARMICFHYQKWVANHAGHEDRRQRLRHYWFRIRHRHETGGTRIKNTVDGVRKTVTRTRSLQLAIKDNLQMYYSFQYAPSSYIFLLEIYSIFFKNLCKHLNAELSERSPSVHFYTALFYLPSL